MIYLKVDFDILKEGRDVEVKGIVRSVRSKNPCLSS